MLEAARCIVVRDLLVAWRRRSDVATALLFFVIVTSLFPLGIGAEPDLLRSIAPGVIWVAALLSCMLSLGRLFAADHADGTLEQLLLSSEPLGVIAAAKALAHWLVSGLPLVLIAPLIALQYDLPAPLYPVLALSLLLDTPVLSLIGAIGAALTLGLRGGGVLLSLLVLPLYVPVLIMGAGSVDMAAAGLAPDGQLLLRAALPIVAAAFPPLASALAPTGALFTFIALWTGSFWGKPTWGTWWVWDARLTSELILLFLYFGFMALQAAIDDRRRAERAGALLAIVGVVNVPIIYYSVQWWNTLHQGASVSLTRAPSMAATMLTGMLVMALAFWMYSIAVTLLRVRCLILENR